MFTAEQQRVAAPDSASVATQQQLPAPSSPEPPPFSSITPPAWAQRSLSLAASPRRLPTPPPLNLLQQSSPRAPHPFKNLQVLRPPQPPSSFLKRQPSPPRPSSSTTTSPSPSRTEISTDSLQLINPLLEIDRANGIGTGGTGSTGHRQDLAQQIKVQDLVTSTLRTASRRIQS